MAEKSINTLAKWPGVCPVCKKRVLAHDHRGGGYAHPAPFTEIYHMNCYFPPRHEQLSMRIRP